MNICLVVISIEVDFALKDFPCFYFYEKKSTTNIKVG